jgi:radical SAM superfamily enzyme
LNQVPPAVVVHRITGDGAKRDLVAPLWSADKKRVLNYLNHYLGK